MKNYFHFYLFILLYLIKSSQCNDMQGYKALFLKKTKLFSKVGNAHILIPMNLNIFDEKLESLDQLLINVNSSFKIENFKGLSKLDIHEAGLARDTLLLNLDLVKDKVSECKKYLQIHKHDFENLNEREQRQIIAAAVGIIGGIVYSQVTHSEALRVLQKDNEIISDTVEMNILKISQTERDVKILNKTDEILKKELLKLFDKTETQTMKLTLLKIETVVSHYIKSCEDFVEGITEAMYGRLTSKFVSLLDLKNNLKRLKQKASSSGFMLSVTSTLEIPHLPTTVILNDTFMNIIISIPIESTSSQYLLYKYVSTPIPLKLNNQTHYLTIKRPDR